MCGFVDDQGEPLNETASNFLVWVPTTYGRAARTAVGANLHYAEDNPLRFGNFTVDVVATPRNTETDALHVFRTDGERRSVVRMEREMLNTSAVAEGSELEFNERKHRYGVDAVRGVGYGHWTSAVRAQLV